MQCFSSKADINEHIKTDLEEESEQLEAKTVRAATRVQASNPRDLDSVLGSTFSFHSDPSKLHPSSLVCRTEIMGTLPTKKSIVQILI